MSEDFDGRDSEETFGIFELFARRQCHVTSRGLSVWKATYRIERLENNST